MIISYAYIRIPKLLHKYTECKWLHKEEWDLLLSWFGGGPLFERKVYQRKWKSYKYDYINHKTNWKEFDIRSQNYISMYPIFIKYILINNSGQIDENNIKIKEYGERQTHALLLLAKEVKLYNIILQS